MIITGDFNIHVDCPTDRDAIRFFDILDSFNLIQHVKSYTHEDRHILDLVITRDCNDVVVSNITTSNFISDHCFIQFQLSHPAVPLSTQEVTYRKLKSINLDDFKNDLATSSLCTDNSSNLQDLCKLYNDTLSTLRDDYAPLITKTLLIRPCIPWFNEEIKSLKVEKRHAEKIWRQTKSTSDLHKFKRCRNRFTNTLNKAESNHYLNLIEENAGDQKKLFNIVKSLTGNQSQNPLQPHTSSKELADSFAEFFTQKIVKIRDHIDSIPSEISADIYLNDTQPNVLFDEFSTLSEDDVAKLISHLSNATSRDDPLPTKFIKLCLNYLLPVITKIINLSLQSGVFPEDWKCALVLPCLKKLGLDLIFSNFRPVSNLQFLSKVTEKAVASQFLLHVQENCPLPALTSAYREFHSPETALVKIHSDIMMAMDQQQVTLLVLLDLSAAFDTVDHDIAIKILNRDFGVEGTALNWFSSYLTGRSQRVVIKDTYSDSNVIKYGVPQGSCLGPIIFTIYASSLFKVISKHLPTVHAFADDTQTYLSFRPSTDSCPNMKSSLENCIMDIKQWMICHKLKLNDSKTEFIIIGSQQQLNKMTFDSIQVGDVDIVSVDCVRNLGSMWDSHMKMDKHVAKVCKAGYFQLYQIRQIRHCLTEDATKTLVHSFVSSHLDYCNSLLYNISAVQLTKLQKLQNSAARLVTLTSVYSHITPVLRDLHWLPVVCRIQFKILLLVYKGLNGKAPAYITEMLKPVNDSRYSLRSSNNLLLVVPRTKCIRFGDRSFASSGPRLWNDLPLHIRQSSNVAQFKSQLKTHLFQLYFN